MRIGKMSWIVLVFGLAFGLGGNAFAGRGELLHFMETLEGNWVGTGTVTAPNDGKNYNLDLTVEYSGNASWHAINRADSETGDRFFDGYFVVGLDGGLTIGKPYHWIPVNVIASTPTALGYRFQRVEGPTGKITEYEYNLAIAPDGKLLGSNVRTRNGAILAEDRFAASRQ